MRLACVAVLRVRFFASQRARAGTEHTTNESANTAWGRPLQVAVAETHSILRSTASTGGNG